MKEAFELLDSAAKKMGLTVDDITINYTVAGRGRALALQKLTIQEYTFEGIHQFVHLGSFLTNDNSVSPQVEARLYATSNSRDIYGPGYYQGETKFFFMKLLPLQHGNFPL